MEITYFEEFVKESRLKFRESLELNADNGNIVDITALLKEMLDECCSEFEEETLKENLQEEFKLYLNSISEGE